MVDFSQIELNKKYTRNVLAEMWGYKSFQAISKGVVTPKNDNKIILFVTRIKQASLTQYDDYISDTYLYWEGEEKHSTDQRIIDSGENGDEVHLFYRDIHHTPFEYMGKIQILSVTLHQDAPTSFIFQLNDIVSIDDEIQTHQSEFSSLDSTERLNIVLSRRGQGLYRRNLISVWDGCGSISKIPFQEILRASHIKPWRSAGNDERMDPYNGLLLLPTYDLLFDKGYVSFSDSGRIIISSLIQNQFYGGLGLHRDLCLSSIYQDNLHYLEYHRDVIFQESA